MFQPCLSWKTENPCKFFIYKGLSSSSCTQTRIEIIKVGKMRVKRKAQKNTAIQLYFKHLQSD